jgi:putative tryptophan/tyrosine transport system substrate-binding protein
MAIHIRRRKFLATLGGAAAWPLAALAQEPMPVIGFLHASSPETHSHLLTGFRKGLSETGFVEGRNVKIEYRWGRDDIKRYRELAADLVRQRVAVIVTPISTAMALAAKAATTTIPIVFSMGTDAVKAGLVASYNQPGGNITGVSAMSSELGAKRLGLLLELKPQAKRIGLLVNPDNSVSTETSIKDVGPAASTVGLSLEVFTAQSPDEIDAAFALMVQKQTEAFIVTPDALFSSRRVQIATLASHYALCAVYGLRDHVDAGGLMSYGPSDMDRYRLIGVYAGRVLKGEKPADMPVQRPTAFEFVINRRAARALGIAIPPTLIALADEVID